jgi:hypothetical protein
MSGPIVLSGKEYVGSGGLCIGLSLILFSHSGGALRAGRSLSVLLTVPIAVFGAFAGLCLRRYDLDVYAQID